jgi:hypothetical protein
MTPKPDHPGVTFSKKPNICNDRELRANLPLPRGHPDIKTFLGIPLFERGGKIIGNICIAKKGGARKGRRDYYTEDDIDFLKPLTVTGSNLIQAYWQVENNNILINPLERKVMERSRTVKLRRRRYKSRKGQRTSSAAFLGTAPALYRHEPRY